MLISLIEWWCCAKYQAEWLQVQLDLNVVSQLSDGRDSTTTTSWVDISRRTRYDLLAEH